MVSAENLRDLSNALLEAGYEEGTLTAYTDQGVAGWVNAKTYRYA